MAPHGDGFSPGKTKNSRSVCLGPLAASLKLWSSFHHRSLKLQVDALKQRMCFHFAVTKVPYLQEKKVYIGLHFHKSLWVTQQSKLDHAMFSIYVVE